MLLHQREPKALLFSEDIGFKLFFDQYMGNRGGNNNNNPQPTKRAAAKLLQLQGYYQAGGWPFSGLAMTHIVIRPLNSVF